MIYPKIQTQRSKSITNIFSKSMLSPDRIETKKRCLIEKFTLALKTKHAKLFKEKGYTQKMLVSDLNDMIVINELDNFNYNAYMYKLDRDILNKVLPMPMSSDYINERSIPNNINTELEQLDSKHKNDKERIDLKNGLAVLSGGILALKKPKNIITTTNDSKQILDDVNNQILSQRNQKLQEYKLKELDLWGIRAKEEKLKYEMEKEEKQRKIREKNIELKETLEKQVQAKRKKDNSLEEDRYFLELQRNIDEQFDQKEKNKKNNMQVAYKEIEKYRQDFLSFRKQKNDEILNKERQIDQQMINNFKKEIDDEQRKKNRKKEAERDHYKKTFESSSLRNSYLNEEKLKEKLENERIDRQFIEQINKKDQDRENYFKSIKDKFKRNGEVTSIAIVQDQLMREMEDKKRIVEIEEQERKSIEDEKRKINKINELKKDMTECLALQVEIKKKQVSNEKEGDKLIGTKLHQEEEKLRQEKLILANKLEEERAVYRKELDRQMNQKRELNKKLMNEDPYQMKYPKSYAEKQLENDNDGEEFNTKH